MPYARPVMLLLLALTLTACGGGGGGGAGATSASSNPANPAPATTTPAASAADPVVPPADASSSPIVTCAPGDAPQTRSALFSLINLSRLALGLSQLTRRTAFDTTAQAHAQYAVANATTAMEETAGRACFTGADLTQRLAAVGVGVTTLAGQRTRSEISVGFDGGDPQPWDYVNNALNSLYGRLVLLDPHVEQVGLGFSVDPASQRRTMVLDTALLPGAASLTDESWVAWPRDGATGLPTRMSASNIKPLDSSVVEGYPVSVHATAVLQVTRFTLTTAADGQAVDTAVLTAANDRNAFLAAGEAALLPRAPLLAGTTYRVELDATVGQTPVHHIWSFTTAP